MAFTFNRQQICQWIAAALLLLSSLACLADSLTATADRTQLSRGETLELQVRFDGQTTSDPDFSVLEEDFEILGQNQQNQFSIINGTTESYTQWVLQLLPKKTGSLLIPPLELKGVQSSPIRLQVAPRSNTSNGSEPIFIETELSKSSVFVQEQVLLTLRLNTSVPLSGLSSEELMIKDAAMVKVAENQYQKQNNGKLYQVVELKYALFPEASGKLVIPPVRFNAVMADRRDRFSGSFFGSRGKPVFLLSDEQHIDVKPRPDNYGPGDWLPAQGLSLSERWSRPLDELVAGEPVTRTLHLTAQGLMDSQLPPLIIDAGDGFKVYPDQPQLENNVDPQGVIGSRVESVAIVPSRAGEITLPPVKIRWWDTRSQQVRETLLESQTLTVKPAPGTVATPADPAPLASDIAVASDTVELHENSSDNRLLWILTATNLLLLVAVITLLILWRGSRKQPATVVSHEPNREKESALFKDLCLSADKQDLPGFREVLLIWAGSFWQRPVQKLSQISHLANDEQVSLLLEALDKSLYSTAADDEVDLNRLCQRLKTLRKTRPEKSPKGTPLSPLYGSHT